MNQEYKSNPFSIVFGKEPKQIIERDQIVDEIISEFTSEEPSQQICLLTGVRGSGKSALTAGIMKEFEKFKNWQVINLLVEGDILKSLANKLYNHSGTREIFNDAKISFSAFGFSAEISDEKRKINAEVELDKMFRALKKKGKRVLITIDDAASTDSMKVFAHFFQACLMKDYDVFLIMNGVYDNIENLQNQKTLTFLQRSPKISLKPFNNPSVANLYSGIFSFPEKTIKELAVLTSGYPYAIQALGYIVWKEASHETDVDLTHIIPKYDNLLAENIYEKLWSDLSEKDREILLTVAESDEQRVPSSKLIEKTGNTKAVVSNYKRRLVKKGIICDELGYFSFALPRFREYILAENAYI